MVKMVMTKSRFFWKILTENEKCIRCEVWENEFLWLVYCWLCWQGRVWQMMKDWWTRMLLVGKAGFGPMRISWLVWRNAKCVFWENELMCAVCFSLYGMAAILVYKMRNGWWSINARLGFGSSWTGFWKVWFFERNSQGFVVCVRWC